MACRSVIIAAVLVSTALCTVTDPCPGHSTSYNIDSKTTVFVCNKTLIQVRQPGKGVTFTEEQWQHMQDKRDSIYHSLGVFDLDGIKLTIGKRRKVLIDENNSTLLLTSNQLVKLLEFNYT